LPVHIAEFFRQARFANYSVNIDAFVLAKEAPTSVPDCFGRAIGQAWHGKQARNEIAAASKKGAAALRSQEAVARCGSSSEKCRTIAASHLGGGVRQIGRHCREAGKNAQDDVGLLVPNQMTFH